MNSKFDIKDKIFVIFGGTGELFGTIAVELANLEAKVIIIGRSKEKVNSFSIYFSSNLVPFRVWPICCNWE